MRPMFTRLQKQRVRVDPETIAILEGDIPDAGRVARWFGLRDCCVDAGGKALRVGSKVAVLRGRFKGSEGVVVMTHTGEPLPFSDKGGARVTIETKTLAQKGEPTRYFHGRAGIILALPEDVKAISSYSKPKGPVEPGWPFPKVRIRNNRNASPGNVAARFLMQASHDRPT